jgi:hypothetical protein
MQSRLAVIAAAATLAACTFTFPPPGGRPGTASQGSASCSRIAERQAARQYAADTSMLDDREGGILGGDSGIQRDLAEIDAESRRRTLYKNCLRQRGLPEAAEGEPAE